MDEMALMVKALVVYELDHPTQIIVRDMKFKSSPHEIYTSVYTSTPSKEEEMVLTRLFKLTLLLKKMTAYKHTPLTNNGP